MKITIITAGSRGDVQPFVALGMGLKRAGHDVKVCTHSNFEGFITGHGLEYAFMNDEMTRFLVSDRGHEVVEKANGAFGWLKTAMEVNKQFKPIMRRMLDEEWEAAQGSELIIGHPKAAGSYDVAEKLGVPLVLSLPLPLMTPTREFPCILFTGARLGGWFNKWSYSFLRYAGALYSKLFNTWRKETLDLPPRKVLAGTLKRSNGDAVPVMYSYSEHVVPRPFDWPETAVVTGYWFLDREDDWQPPGELTAFLEAGPPPVYVGFGSIAGKDPAKTASSVVDALQKAGQRGIIASGWGGLEASSLPDSIFKIEQAPHDWLMPRVSAVVHHGGAGTTAAGLRAGKPTVICPFFGDQPFWAERMLALGVGPEAVPHKKLTADKLADAIRIAATDEGMRLRAEALGKKIRAEDGVARGVEFVEGCAAGN